MFFAKTRVKSESINDLNKSLITFYRVCKSKNLFPLLEEKIKCTLHSEATWIETKDVLKSVSGHSDIDIAYSVWYQCNFSFGKTMFTGLGFDNVGATTSSIRSKKHPSLSHYAID